MKIALGPETNSLFPFHKNDVWTQTKQRFHIDLLCLDFTHVKIVKITIWVSPVGDSSSSFVYFLRADGCRPILPVMRNVVRVSFWNVNF